MAKHKTTRKTVRKKSFTRRLLGLGLLAGVGYAVWRAIEANRDDRDSGWEPQPFPFPPTPRVEAASERTAAGGVSPPAESERDNWVEPDGSSCPTSHPVKAKVDKGIFHVPGGFNYDATKPDRCYKDAAAAEADGLRQSKR